MAPSFLESKQTNGIWARINKINGAFYLWVLRDGWKTLYDKARRDKSFSEKQRAVKSIADGVSEIHATCEWHIWWLRAITAGRTASGRESLHPWCCAQSWTHGGCLANPGWTWILVCTFLCLFEEKALKCEGTWHWSRFLSAAKEILFSKENFSWFLHLIWWMSLLSDLPNYTVYRLSKLFWVYSWCSAHIFRKERNGGGDHCVVEHAPAIPVVLDL